MLLNSSIMLRSSNLYPLVSNTLPRVCLVSSTRKLHGSRFSLTEKYTDKTDEGVLIFKAPSGNPVRLVKRLSFVTTSLGVVSIPLFWFGWEYPIVQDSGLQYSTVVIACLASVCSTSFLHWFCSPYVTKILLHPSKTSLLIHPHSSRTSRTTETEHKESDASVKNTENQLITPSTRVTFETTSITGSPVLTTVQLGDLVLGRLPHVTWRVRSHSGTLSRLLTPISNKGPNNEHPLPQSKFWIDLPKVSYRGADIIHRMNAFLYDWSPK